MALCADCEPPHYEVSGVGRTGPETTEASYQARWCERATAYRSMLHAGAEDSGNMPTSTDRGRTNALRRRLLLLRQPRPPTTKPAATGGTLARPGNVEQYINEGLDIIFARDAEYAWRPVDAGEQYYRNREAMLRQYQTWNGIDIKKINLPFYPEPVFHKALKISRKGRSWMVDDPAARQLSQRASRTPPVGRFGMHFSPARMTPSNGSANFPRRILQEDQEAFSRPAKRPGHVVANEPFRQRGVAASIRSSTHTPPMQQQPPPRAPPPPARKSDGSATYARSPTTSPPQAAAELRRSPQPRSGGAAVRERSVRFSEELTVHEHSNNDDDDGDGGWREATAESSTAAATRSRAMTAVLLSQRQPMAGGRAEYVEKLRKKSRRQFLHALDRVIARLKRAKLGGGGGESPRRAPSESADRESASETI